MTTLLTENASQQNNYYEPYYFFNDDKKKNNNNGKTTLTRLCFNVPGSVSDQYQLTFNPLRYYGGTFNLVTTSSLDNNQIQWRLSSNSAGDKPAYYCIRGSTTVYIDQYDQDRVTVEMKKIHKTTQRCRNSQPGLSRRVFWWTDLHYLQADDFEYQVTGEEPVSLLGAKNIDLKFNSSDMKNTTIDVTWEDVLDGGRKRRIVLFLSATLMNNLNDYYDAGQYYVPLGGNSWTLFEARVYNSNQDWVQFIPSMKRDGLAHGYFDDRCFHRDRFVISNQEDGSEIRFRNLVFTPFWLSTSWGNTYTRAECLELADRMRMKTKLHVETFVSVVCFGTLVLFLIRFCLVRDISKDRRSARYRRRNHKQVQYCGLMSTDDEEETDLWLESSYKTDTLVGQGGGGGGGEEAPAATTPIA
jgi:hypothetical protein